jgi:nitrite reductase (cytochrome c-552)
VCAQCHVEYYFDKHRKDTPDVAYLTFPWQKGTNAEQILNYYDSIGFTDFTNQLSKAPILKAQHPDYEIFLTGIHAERGVACADCHMPYVTEGGQKYTSHRVASPLTNVANTCQVCHRQSEEQLKENVYERQEKIKEMRDQAEIELVRAHMEAKAAWDAGATEAEMKPVLQKIRNGQWYWDYTAASHGASFHAPVTVAADLGKSMAETQGARVELARILAKHGVMAEIPYPPIETKAKAQEFIGLPMDQLRKEKAEFMKIVVPEWVKKAEERESKWPIVEI